jgi:lambda repressor-like predicted transcriptional regulator
MWTDLAMLPPLHPEDIKAPLRIRYGTVGKFEKLAGLPPRSVSQVLYGKAIERAAEAIADELDIPLYRVSEHYHSLFYKLSTAPRHRRNPPVAHRQNDEAA